MKKSTILIFICSNIFAMQNEGVPNWVLARNDTPNISHNRNNMLDIEYVPEEDEFLPFMQEINNLMLELHRNNMYQEIVRNRFIQTEERKDMYQIMVEHSNYALFLSSLPHITLIDMLHRDRAGRTLIDYAVAHNNPMIFFRILIAFRDLLRDAINRIGQPVNNNIPLMRIPRGAQRGIGRGLDAPVRRQARAMRNPNVVRVEQQVIGQLPMHQLDPIQDIPTLEDNE